MKTDLKIFALIASIICITLFMINGCGTNATSSGGSSSTSWIYCSNNADNTISIINGSTNTITGSIEVFGTPTWLAASPDNKHIYCISNSTTDVYAINTATNTVETTYVVGGNLTQFDRVAASADNKFLFITRWNDLALHKLNLSTGTEESITTGGENPYCIALSANGKYAYIPVYGNNVLVVTLGTLATHNISAQTNEMFGYGINAAIKDNKMYMTLQVSRECLVIDLTAEAVTHVMKTDATGLMGIVSTPGKNTLYAANSITAGEIRMIDASVPTFEASIITGNSSFTIPSYMAAANDGSKVYVYDPATAGQICVIKTSNNTIEAYIPIGNGGSSGYECLNPVIIYK